MIKLKVGNEGYLRCTTLWDGIKVLINMMGTLMRGLCQGWRDIEIHAYNEYDTNLKIDPKGVEGFEE